MSTFTRNLLNRRVVCTQCRPSGWDQAVRGRLQAGPGAGSILVRGSDPVGLKRSDPTNMGSVADAGSVARSWCAGDFHMVVVVDSFQPRWLGGKPLRPDCWNARGNATSFVEGIGIHFAAAQPPSRLPQSPTMRLKPVRVLATT
jgi:hypothetical protein